MDETDSRCRPGVKIVAAMDLAFKKGIVTAGSKVVIVAGVPYYPPGQADFLRVATLKRRTGSRG